LVPYRNRKAELNKQQLKFSLKQGDNLPRNKAPFVKQRTIRMTARVPRLVDGVIAAQGGGTHGWAIYVREKKLNLAITRGGQRELMQVAAPEGPGTIEMEIRKDGSAQISWNGDQIADHSFSGALTEQPQDGLQIGRDLNGQVGDYRVPFAFGGEISQVEITLLK
jgi:hypothetical protein